MQVSAVNVSLTAGRQRPDGDLDELVDGEHRVLGEGAVGPGHVGLGQGRSHLARAAPAGQTVASGRSATTKCPGRWASRITASSVLGDLDQLPVADELQVAALSGRDLRTAGRQLVDQIGGLGADGWSL